MSGIRVREGLELGRGGGYIYRLELIVDEEIKGQYISMTRREQSKSKSSKRRSLLGGEDYIVLI